MIRAPLLAKASEYKEKRIEGQEPEMERSEGENKHVEENSNSKDGSICGYESLHHLLSANLKPHLFKEVSRLLLGLNCGRALELVVLPESAKALSSEHDFDLQSDHVP
ncbi:hypothetical protein GH714_028199 [Hevea brasiliensis]|uniref:Uncharacterized protein n=1 Tax=Hevea brasiliensis TaxID=3981 RepID=A0A6A6N8M9_HEVBR|nr:hypothetical protein GH714_028199 [Hevea brasiliensis]